MSSINKPVNEAFKDETISVSQLNKLAKTLLENNIPMFWIKGEISGLRNYSHMYFDLKDDKAKIACVLFANYLPLIDFTLANGQQIEVRGKVTIYPANGAYQINVERVRKIGMGELWEAYNRLLNKLKLEGLFAVAHKKILPLLPHAIGVVTSKDGSVIRDVVTTLHRRMPGIPIIIYHTPVQGADAAMQIARMVRLANKRNEVDVLIVCRGGGSMEDLWCFNQEVVAREVFASQIPIISAIGHETDITIIDFVSDVRAPTPTAAAELVVKSRTEWLGQIAHYFAQLNKNIYYRLNSSKQALDIYSTKLQALSPRRQLELKQQWLYNVPLMLKHRLQRIVTKSDLALELYKLKLKQGLKQVFTDNANKLRFYKAHLNPNQIGLKRYHLLIQANKTHLQQVMQRYISVKAAQIESHHRHLVLLNPDNVLLRGYAIVKSLENQVLSSTSQLNIGNKIQLVLKDGIAVATVLHKK